MDRGAREPTINDTLPQPIAAAWARYRSAQDKAAQLRCIEQFVEVLAATLGALALADLLRRPDDLRGDAARLLNDARAWCTPSIGLRWALIEAVSEALDARGEPYLQELSGWVRGPGGACFNPLHRARNALSHNKPPDLATVGEWDERAQALVESLRWLGAYRVVRCRAARHGKAREVGDVWIFAGNQMPPPVGPPPGPPG